MSKLRPDFHDRDHVRGHSDAPVTLVEYGDYECPHCFRAHPIIESLMVRLSDRLRFVFRNFPLTQIHSHAQHSAEAAESVSAHAGADAFWSMHNSLFEHQQDSTDALDDAHLVGYAVEAGADPVRVQRDLDNSTFAPRVRDDFRSGIRSGVNGTPTFFINGVRYDGKWDDPTVFADALNEAAQLAVSK